MSAHPASVVRPLPQPARYCPYSQLGTQPNIVVDGAPQEATELTLSHWPWTATDDRLLRDTSTAIVFAYLDSPEFHRNIPLVSNSHFDEDGVLSMYVLTDPQNALRHRELLIGASRAGDFGVYTDIEAAKLSFVLAAHADPELSPFPHEIFAGSAALQVAGLYHNMLAALPELLKSYANYKAFWEAEVEHLAASEAAIRTGHVVIDTIPDVETAIVWIPEDMRARTVRRYLRRWQRSVHPFAVHNVTDCTRLIWIKGNSLEFQYRYESWVKFASRRPLQRVDMSGLAEQLNVTETGGGEWIFEGVNEVAPRLRIDGSCRSSVKPEKFVALVAEHLRSQPPAWDPYNKPD